MISPGFKSFFVLFLTAKPINVLYLESNQFFQYICHNCFVMCLTFLFYIFACVALRWVDNSQVSFQMWEEGQPDFINFDENCVAMMSHNGE